MAKTKQVKSSPAPEYNFSPELLKVNDIISLAQRRYFRLNYVVRTTLITLDKRNYKAITGYTSNVSDRGFYLITPNFLAENTKVKIIMRPYARTPFHLEGEVIWVNDTWQPENKGMGIIITSPDSIFDMLNLSIAPQKLRRQFLRVDCKLKVKLAAEKANLAGYTNNISYQGFFIHCTKLIPELTQVKIFLILPDGKEIALLGSVVWTRQSQDKKNCGLGVCVFLDLQETTMDITPAQYKKSFKAYVNFINSLLKKPAPKK
ncbi:MAG: PilZ domain-containing protein [Spirochaetales bacterium]|nr:PilZ domain-containing protein [Spirochaetales bacterium]